jgi:hypothetical protein
MSKYKYFVSVFLTIIIIAPSITFASWWNPFSWSIFRKADTKTQILENRIVELETKLNDIATTSQNIKEKNKIEITTPNVVTPVTAITVTPTQPQPNPTAPTVDLYAKYRDPKTGNIMTPTEWADYVADKLTQKEINPATGKTYTLSDFGLEEANMSNENSNPYVNLKVNEQDGPITIKANSLVNVSWTSANVVSCSGSTKDKPLNGRETINVDSDTISPFTIRCLTSNGVVVSDSVVLNITDKTPYNYDPYNVLSGSGNAYSPEQLNSIDCAYYGRNCPTIDVRILNR